MSHSIALVNHRDGSVQGHSATCADLKRGKAKFADAPWLFEVDTRLEAWEAYNGDFIPECYDHDNCDEAAGQCANAYDINWLPCASHVPAFAEETEAPAAAPVVVVRTGSKRTLITVDGEEVAYVLNQFAAAAEAMVRASL